MSASVCRHLLVVDERRDRRHAAFNGVIAAIRSAARSSCEPLDEVLHENLARVNRGNLVSFPGGSRRSSSDSADPT